MRKLIFGAPWWGSHRHGNQVIHRASTNGSKVNRRALQAWATVLTDLLPVFLEIIIDDGIDVDWAAACFPPDFEGPRRTI